MKPWSGNKDQMSADETVAYWRKANGCRDAVQQWELADRDPGDGCRVKPVSGKATLGYSFTR